jgi:hypothetical protein
MPTAEWEANKTTPAEKDVLVVGVWRQLAHTMRAVGSLRLMILDEQPCAPLPAHRMTQSASSGRWSNTSTSRSRTSPSTRTSRVRLVVS